MRTESERDLQEISYESRTSTELRLFGHHQEVATTTIEDVHRAFIEVLFHVGGGDDGGVTFVCKTLELSRAQLAAIRKHGRLLPHHIDRWLEKTDQSPSDWFAYITRLAATLEGMRSYLSDEEAELPGEKDAKKYLSGSFLPASIDVEQLPVPDVPRELLVTPRRGRPQKPSVDPR
jgi:hypothetical protein